MLPVLALNARLSTGIYQLWLHSCLFSKHPNAANVINCHHLWNGGQLCTFYRTVVFIHTDQPGSLLSVKESTSQCVSDEACLTALTNEHISWYRNQATRPTWWLFPFNSLRPSDAIWRRRSWQYRFRQWLGVEQIYYVMSPKEQTQGNLKQIQKRIFKKTSF